MLAAFGATAGAALITVSRAELTRAVGRRLRGAAPSLAWLAQIDYYLTAASATTSLGVLLARRRDSRPPGGLRRARAWWCCSRCSAVPLVLFAAYLVPRWLTQPRAETRGRPGHPRAPALVPGARRCCCPARTATRPTDLRVDLARGRRGRAPRRRRAGAGRRGHGLQRRGRCAR